MLPILILTKSSLNNITMLPSGYLPLMFNYLMIILNQKQLYFHTNYNTFFFFTHYLFICISYIHEYIYRVGHKTCIGFERPVLGLRWWDKVGRGCFHRSI